MDYTTKLSNNTNPSFKITRKEVVNSLAYNASKQAVLYSQGFSNDDTLQGEVIEAYELGAEYGYKFAIDKACEWLADSLVTTPYGIDLEGNLKPNKEIIKPFLDDFKKAMEE